MASKAGMMWLLKRFGFEWARDNWEQYGELAFACWEEMTPKEQEEVARENHLAAVWRAGLEFGLSTALIAEGEKEEQPF